MLEGVVPGVVRRRQGRHPGAPAAPGAPRAARRRARLPLLLRRRAAPPLHRARRRAASSSRSPTRWRPASAVRSTGSTCRCRAAAPTRRTTRRSPSCGCARRPSSTSGSSTTPTASRARARRIDGGRAASPRASASPPSAAGAGAPPPTLGELLRIHRELSRPLHDPAGARTAFDWPAGFARVPDEDWTRQPVDTFGLRYDTVENHGWYRNLDPTVEDLARHLDERTDPRGLLGRHRHPARPPQAARVRPPLRRADRRQLAEVPARRPRQVPATTSAWPSGCLRWLKDERRLRAPRGGARRRRCSRAASTRSPPPTRSTSTSTCRGRSPRGRACCGRAGACSCSPATSAIPTRSPRSGCSTRRCGRSTRSPWGSCATTRATPPIGRRSTTRRGWRPTWPTATACSCPCVRSTTTCAA